MKRMVRRLVAHVVCSIYTAAVTILLTRKTMTVPIVGTRNRV